MSAPFIGPPTDAPGCAWSADIDQHACGAPPDVHIATIGPWGLVVLSSCRQHAEAARQAGDFIAQHPYRFGCDTGLCWPLNATAVPAVEVHVYQPGRRRKAAWTAIRRILGALLTWPMVITAMTIVVVVASGLR